MQIRLHGASVPIRVGRHSGSKMRHTNSATRTEHLELIRYWKCSYSTLVSRRLLELVRSYWSTPRHRGNEVDLQMPERSRPRKGQGVSWDGFFRGELTSPPSSLLHGIGLSSWLVGAVPSSEILKRFKPSVVISNRDRMGNVGDTLVRYRLESVVEVVMPVVDEDAEVRFR